VEKVVLVAGITRDTTEGDNEDPLTLHKYLYCAGNPVNQCDPSGHDFGEFEMGFGIGLTLESLLDYRPPGHFHIRVHEAKTGGTGTGIGVRAWADGNPDGFYVTYIPGDGVSGDDIVVYQIIASKGTSAYAPKVDSGNGVSPATGDPLPPAMKPIADSPTSYQDSPWDDGSGAVATWCLTAVAVERTSEERGGDRVLCTEYFEFNNATRKITNKDLLYKDEYRLGMLKWWGQ
jgi:hypothetical protein